MAQKITKSGKLLDMSERLGGFQSVTTALKKSEKRNLFNPAQPIEDFNKIFEWRSYRYLNTDIQEELNRNGFILVSISTNDEDIYHYRSRHPKKQSGINQ